MDHLLQLKHNVTTQINLACRIWRYRGWHLVGVVWACRLLGKSRKPVHGCIHAMRLRKNFHYTSNFLRFLSFAGYIPSPLICSWEAL